MISKIINKYNRLSLLKKMLLIFIIIIFIPLNSFYFYSAHITEEIMIEQTYLDHMNNNNLIRKSINDFLTRITSVIMFIYNDNNLQEIIEYENKEQLTGGEKFEKLKIIDKFKNSIQNLSYNTLGMDFYITIISPKNVIYTSYYTEQKKMQKYISQYTAGKINNYNNYIIEKGLEPNYIDEEENSYLITFLKTIDIQSEEDNNGLLIISIPEDSFSKMMIGEGKYSSANRFLINENGQIISSSNEKFINKYFENIYHETIPERNNGYIVDKISSGIKSLITYSKIGNSTWNNWQLVNIVSYQSVIGVMENTLQRLFVVNLLIIIIFFIIAIVLAKSITSPIQKLSNIMLETSIENEGEEEDKLKSNINEIMILEKSFVKMKNNVRNLIVENKFKEQKKREAELQALQAQISPHFLFNTLNAVRWAAINNKGKKAANMVFALSNLLKMTIVRGDELIKLEQEIENIKNYVSIIKLRHATDFEVEFSIEDNTKCYLVPRLLLQPIVENAILHGFENLDKVGLIKISTTYEKDNLLITIEDNGIGMKIKELEENQEAQKYAKFTGIGVSNVDERIKLYYGDKYGLSINSQLGKGTIVKIILPGEASENDQNNNC